MTSLFRNSSPGALTREQAVALAKKRIAERHRQMRQAQELAAQGRGGDTEVAHVARGELVVPWAMQTPEVIAVLQRAAATHDIPFEMLSVGSAMNRINPNTGAPEFGLLDGIGDFVNERIESAKKEYDQWFGGDPSAPAPVGTMSPNPKINESKVAPTYEELGFDPNGPKLGTAVLHDPWAGIVGGVSGMIIREQAKNRFGGGKPAVDGPGNGWQHSRWSQVTSDWTSPERAKAITDAYERSQNFYGTAEQLKDLYNNMVGRGLAPNEDPRNAINRGYIRISPFK